MKKLCCLLAILLLAALTAPAALADVIWEPYEDDFYAEHAEECQSVSRDFRVEAASGSVTVYKDPLSDKEEAVFANGVEIYIGFTWTDTAGKVWGVVSFETAPGDQAVSVFYNGQTGWLPMDELTQLYGAEDFWTEHEAAFTELEEPVQLPVDEPLTVWTYPDSGVTQESIDFELWGWTPEDAPESYTRWTDESGNEWYYISYYYQVSGWVCPGMSAEPASETRPPAPAATQIPVFQTPIPVPEPKSAGLGWVVALVVVVAAATAVILVLFFVKKKKAPVPAAKPEPSEQPPESEPKP